MEKPTRRPRSERTYLDALEEAEYARVRGAGLTREGPSEKPAKRPQTKLLSLSPTGKSDSASTRSAGSASVRFSESVTLGILNRRNPPPPSMSFDPNGKYEQAILKATMVLPDSA